MNEYGILLFLDGIEIRVAYATATTRSAYID
jgi:hypothetical protein